MTLQCTVGPFTIKELTANMPLLTYWMQRWSAEKNTWTEQSQQLCLIFGRWDLWIPLFVVSATEIMGTSFTCSGILQNYWVSVTETINSVFQTEVKLYPTACLLGILDQCTLTKAASSKAQFQARKLILQYWKSEQPLTHKQWVQHMGTMQQLERVIFHRGCPAKFERCGIPGRPRMC